MIGGSRGEGRAAHQMLWAMTIALTKRNGRSYGIFLAAPYIGRYQDLRHR